MVRFHLWFAAACAVAAAACGDNAPTAPDGAITLPEQTITLTQTLVPGTVEEGTWQAAAGQEIRLYLAASAPALDWDIHAHAGGDTQDVAYAFGQSDAAYDFVAPNDGPWYLLLRNHSDATIAVDIGMELYPGTTWQGFH